MSMSERERAVRHRLKTDFEHYAEKCLRIKTKSVGKGLMPLKLNPAQRLLHEAAERQLRERGKVRILILKARQLGGSTYVQARMMWKTTHIEGMQGYVMAHKDDSTAKMFKMAKIFYENLPDLVKPSRAASNSKEMEFDKLFSGYKIATAGGRESGRSETIHFLHLSEAAYFPDAEATMAAVLEAVPGNEGTESWIESTSAGPTGRFYEMCAEALAGKSEYEVVFCGWFLDPDYSAAPPPDFVPTEDEEAYRDEVAEKAGYLLSDAQLYWRRLKIVTGRGIHVFRREYPSTPEEAFRVEAPGALWKAQTIANTRVAKVPEEVSLVRVVVAVDPSGGKGDKNDAQGIVVAGLGSNGHVYVLEDATCRKSPAGWGARAVEMFDKWKADRVVAETNFGGEMVGFVLDTVRPGIPKKDLIASRGKAIRAEPVAALYEQGTVHHVGFHYMLEDELVTWDPMTAKKSPNRLDALVWAVTELAVSGNGWTANRKYEV